jgi:hypothetical protein
VRPRRGFPTPAKNDADLRPGAVLLLARINEVGGNTAQMLPAYEVAAARLGNQAAGARPAQAGRASAEAGGAGARSTGP